jgi:hypothetical protein
LVGATLAPMLSNRNTNRTAKARQGRRRGEPAVMYGAAGEWLEEQPLRDRQGKSATRIGKACAAGKIDGAPKPESRQGVSQISRGHRH